MQTGSIINAYVNYLTKLTFTHSSPFLEKSHWHHQRKCENDMASNTDPLLL